MPKGVDTITSKKAIEQRSKRLSEQNKKNWADPEYRIRMTESSRKTMVRLNADPKFWELRAAGNKKQWQDEEFRKTQRRGVEKNWRTDKTFRKNTLEAFAKGRANTYITTKKQWENPEFAEAVSRGVSKASKKRWKNPEYVRKVLGSHNRTSKPQLLFLNLLTHLATAYSITEIRLEHVVGRYSIDIAIINWKVAIEIDGSYWHRNSRDKEDVRDNYLRRKGWRVFRVVAENMFWFEDYLLHILHICNNQEMYKGEWGRLHFETERFEEFQTSQKEFPADCSNKTAIKNLTQNLLHYTENLKIVKSKRRD